MAGSNESLRGGGWRTTRITFTPGGFTDGFYGTGAPTDGTNGSFAGLAGKGSRYTRTSNGALYINTNTTASPTWTLVGTVGAGSIVASMFAAGAVDSAAIDPSITQAATVSLSAADIIALHSAPKTLVAAPGVGKALLFEGLFWSFTYNSVQMTGGGAVQAQYHGATTNLMSSTIAQASIQAAANSTVQFIPATTASGIVVVANAAIELIAASADFAAGNSTAKAFIKYRVITL